MVNTREKGNRIERKAQESLEEQGYEVARMPHTRYGDNDFFNIFDIIAVKPGAPFKCVQVKSNQASKLEEFKADVREKIPFKYAEVEYWIWHDYQGWEKRLLNSDSSELKVFEDERS